MASDQFGVLLHPLRFELSSGLRISPLPEFEELRLSLLEGSSPSDHVILPENCSTVRRGILYKLPSTHQVEGSIEADRETFRRGTGAFLLGLISVLYDCRLQWEDWWHDGLIFSQQHDRVHLRPTDFESFLGRAIEAWNRFDETQRSLYLNALAFHQKANGYARGFEVFYADFTALEALWHFGLSCGTWTVPEPNHPNRGHAKRLRRMLVPLGILDPDSPDCSDQANPCIHPKCQSIRSIYDARNRLFHEAAWGDQMGIMTRSFMPPARDIHLLVKRALIAALGFRNDFTKSTWWSFGSVYSDWRTG